MNKSLQLIGLAKKIAMTAVDQAAELLSKMTSGEKVQLFQLVASELGATDVGVESRPDVCGGEPCIVRTRIPVWVLEQSRRLGATDSELLRSYPTLQPGDLLNAQAYVARHREAVEEQILANESA